MDFTNTTVLITGSTAGIGAETARVIADVGGAVVVSGRDATRGAEVVDDIRARGGAARFVAADLADPSSIARLADEVGEVDVLVNNAAGYAVEPSTSITADSFDQMFAINVRAPFLLVAKIAPGMAARGSGVVVNVSTMAADMGLAGMALYSSSKGALNSLTRAWAAEFGGQGVRVVGVAPGPTRTDMVAETLGEEGAAQVAALTMLGRLATPREIADVIAFVASSGAAFMTGATVAVDAGATAR
jgi:NAD(P)-dependent dehydrogenase (short-subunit alcohol dehydrogenase family)